MSLDHAYTRSDLGRRERNVESRPFEMTTDFITNVKDIRALKPDYEHLYRVAGNPPRLRHPVTSSAVFNNPQPVRSDRGNSNHKLRRSERVRRA